MNNPLGVPKILGIIPTARRTIAPKVARAMSDWCEKILILSKECEIPLEQLPSNTQEVPMDNLTLAGTRDVGTRTAMGMNYEYVLQVDDDIVLNSTLLNALIDTAVAYPAIGAVSSPSSVELYWAKDLHPNKPWIMYTHSSQVTLMRCSAARTVASVWGDIYAEGIDTMEDMILGFRMWSLGIPTVRLHGDRTISHGLAVTRKSKEQGDAAGGHLMHERNAAMPLAVKYINDNFVGPDQVVKSMKFAIKGGVGKYYPRYNWDQMSARSMERNGSLGYLDSKGRIL